MLLNMYWSEVNMKDYEKLEWEYQGVPFILTLDEIYSIRAETPATSTTAETPTTHDNICVICRQLYSATCCCIHTATGSSSYANSSTSTSSSSSSNNNSHSGSKSRHKYNHRKCNRNIDNGKSDETSRTFPSNLAASQHCSCQQHYRWQQHQQEHHQHAAQFVHECCCVNSSRSSSNSTNDNNQKITATTANCHCNCINNNNNNNNNTNINKNNINNSNNQQQRLQYQHQQPQNNYKIHKIYLNILHTLQLCLMFVETQIFLRNCCNPFRRDQQQQHQQQQHRQQSTKQQQLSRQTHHKQHRHEQYQHYYQRQPNIAFIIIALLTMHATTTMALQYPNQLTLQHPYQQQQQTLTDDSFGSRVAALTRQPRSIDNWRNSGNNSNRTMSLADSERPCKSMDIRNTISELNQLANCTVIEGFLLISLINDADKLNKTYPLLTEVTGYIMLYRVYNLLSLSQIFPNLRVIRGNVLFESYALIAYQNRDLQDIGLTNLRAISNGGVRFERNAYLCYVKTVNWRQILSKNASDSDIVYKFNRNVDECARCPSDTDEQGNSNDVSDGPTCKEHSDGKRYCWNGRSCQTICPESCPYNCIDEHTCCNSSCLGGCFKDGGCHACRNVSIHGGKCVNQCPDNYFLYENRCITAEMCEQINTKYENSKQMKLVHFKGKCTTRCDKGYSIINNTCEKCNGTCEKVCDGGTIDSSVRAMEFHGCTVIGHTEGLTISIKRGGAHVMDALVSGLGSVHTINTFLKVHLTYGLTSLDFFKSLHTIRGNHTVEGRYALYVLENRDLASLWGVNQTVNIKNGSVFFHFNPQLCLEVIDKLKPMLPNKPEKFNKNEVAEDSNGNKGTCNTLWMDARVFKNQTAFNFFIVTINTTTVSFDDERSFIGYQVFYTLDPNGNVTRDNYQPCTDTWSVAEPTKDTPIMIANLQPYTKYALYVRTMTISAEKRNYQSDIIRLRTMPDKPMHVRPITAPSISSSEILLSWKPPFNVRGKLVKYQVRVELTRRDSKLEEYRNFCRDPLPVNDPKPVEKTPAKEADCKCEEVGRTTFDKQSAEQNIFDEIDFENTLQNFLFVRKPETGRIYYDSGLPVSDNSIRRRRRYIESNELDSVLMRHVRSVNEEKSIKSKINSTKSVIKQPISNNSKDDDDFDNWVNMTYMDEDSTYYKMFSAEVDANTTTYLFKKLRHFSLYSISVRACREKEGTDDIRPLCSEVEPWQNRTQKLEQADKALNLTGKLVNLGNTTRGNVELHWLPPPHPNGAIVSFTIIYERQEENSVAEKRCITIHDYQNQSSYMVPNLSEGTYSFSVKANSLAGEGDLSEYYYVVVPPPKLATWVILVIVATCLIIIGLLAASASYAYIMKKKAHPQDLIINTEVNPFYATLQYVPDDWEVPRERIIQLGPLGQGSFGMVYEGILKAQNTSEDVPCAIKTVNENATDRERTNFLSEASVMKEFDTYHVVRLLGVCSRGQPALVVMELMKKGDLKSYLRAHRPDEREDVLAVYQQRIGLTTSSGVTAGAVQPPPYSRIFQMAIEIADGMAYLAAKKFVHRDLAARNCMVADDLTVKIGDFGMTRDIYETDYYRKGTKGLLPVRWMPPESLRDGIYASSSDVFSYGVVLWEMATLASQPYQGLSNEQVLRYVIDGGIMERPDNCPDILHNLMNRCWHHRPSARPSFLQIIAYLENLSDSKFKEVAFYYSDAGVQYREKERKERNQTDIFAGGRLDADIDAEDATTPLRVGEYQGYKGNMDHNASLEHPAESPIALVDDQATTHSPFSMHSGFIVSSTPDALSTLPTAGGSHMEDAAYVQPDADVTDAERGYELYDPSPNFVELPHSGGRLSGEQHLLPKKKRGGASITPSMSSSMPDDVIGGGVSNTGGGMTSSSLQPSTASAASSNASSSRHPSLKRVVADTLRHRVGYGLLSRFNHKRSGSNASHKSNVSNAPSSSSNTNLTSHPAGMAMVTMGPNLSTIESGGSGSAGSYTGTPRFYTPTAMTPSTGGNGSTTIISDNPNYKLLDESVNSSDPVNSMFSPDLITSSLNPNYELMQPPTSEGAPFSILSDNPNYVLMSEPQSGPDQVYTTNNPNYAPMLAPTHMQPSSSDDNENDDDDDDEDADEHTEHIKMERMPLSRQKPRARVKPTQQQPRSRSVSQTRKGDTPTSTPTATSAAATLAPVGNTSNILKENWLRQPTTPRPPPPNGFIGREA